MVGQGAGANAEISFKEAAINQLTSTSCARSWVIVCALVSLLAPLSAHAADWRMSGNDLTNDRNQPNENSDRHRQCGHSQTRLELQDAGQRLGNSSGNRRLRLCPRLGRRPTQAQRPNRIGRLVPQSVGIHWLSQLGIAHHAGVGGRRSGRRATAAELRRQARQLLSAGPKPRNRRSPLGSDAGQASGDDFDAVTGRL